MSDRLPSNQPPTLLQIATATRKIAQEFLNYNNKINLLSISLSCFALCFNEVVAWVLVTIGFISKVTAFYLNHRGQQYHYLSREAQRLAILEDAYGNILEPFQVVELRKKIGKKIENIAKNINFGRGYYTSEEKKGNKRLKFNIHQSTFWSRSLLDIHVKNLRIIIIASLFVIVFPIYVLIVPAFDVDLFSINPYLLSLIGLTLILGFIDYTNNMLLCTSSLKTLYDVDQRLEKVNINNYEVLLAAYADYSIATVTAPPIPHNIYIKNRDRLIDLWNERISVNIDESFSMIKDGKQYKVVIDYNNKILPSWIKKKNFENLIYSAAFELADISKTTLPESISIERILSYSGTPVFDIHLFKNKTIWRHLILRFHKNKEDAQKEFEIINMIKQEGIDILAYIPLTDPFIQKGALFYYHADMQTHDQLEHINKYIANFLIEKRNDIDSYFLKMFSGLSTLAMVFDRISSNYRTVTFEQYLFSLKKTNYFPSYVIDLTKKQFNYQDNTLIIEGHFHKLNNIMVIDASKFNPRSTEWVKCELEIIKSFTYHNNNVTETVLKIGKYYCSLLTKSDNGTDLLENRWKYILLKPKSKYPFSPPLKKKYKIGFLSKA